MSIFGAVARQRCPVCLEGRVFCGTFRMREACPVCGHRFERAPGFFVGAMYVSYAISVPVYFLLALAVRSMLPGWPLLAVMGLVLVLFLPLVPVVFRLSRVLWMHFMRAIDPTG